jgi:hypothetical protein
VSDMDKGTGPDDGQAEHPAGAGGSAMGPAGVPSGRDAGPGGRAPHPEDLSADGDRQHRDPLVGPDEDPRLTAFLERTTEALQTRPIEFTAHRHLAAMRTAAAETVIRRRQHVMRLAGVAAAAVVAAVVTFAGFGALPAPAQHVMSEVADRLGFTIPSPDTDPAESVGNRSKQRPAPETVPGLPGGPDRSQLPGLRDDGVLQTPGRSNGMTPPGQRDDRTVPGQQDRGTPPGQDDGGSLPAPDERPDRPGPGDTPGAPEGTPGADPGQPNDPPGQSADPPGQPSDPPGGSNETPPPPARGQGSDTSDDGTSTTEGTSDEGKPAETGPPSEKGKQPPP